MQLRKSEEVVQQLLDSMCEIVTQYHETVKQTGVCVTDLIDGTAFFPGGSGLWRGGEKHGALPELFPDAPIMFVGHNFDSIRGFNKAHEDGGEPDGQFWKKLLGILHGAALSPKQCFFTNALMGLKPGSSTGSMPGDSKYRKQCAMFLRKQVEIVKPKAVIALGVKAESFVARLGKPWKKSLHPSARHFNEKATREERLKEQGEQIAEFLRDLI